MNISANIFSVGLVSLFSLCAAEAAVTSSFVSQSATYDGQSSANVALFDPSSSINFTMTVSAIGGNLNSNATGLGVGDAQLNTGESISISFNVNTFIHFLDLGEIGADVNDGATVTIGASPSFDLYTGQPDFAGTTDIWTPATPVELLAGESIVFSGSSASSVFDLDGLQIAAVPEPSSCLLLGFGGLALLSRRNRVAL